MIGVYDDNSRVHRFPVASAFGSEHTLTLLGAVVSSRDPLGCAQELGFSLALRLSCLEDKHLLEGDATFRSDFLGGVASNALVVFYRDQERARLYWKLLKYVLGLSLCVRRDAVFPGEIHRALLMSNERGSRAQCANWLVETFDFSSVSGAETAFIMASKFFSVSRTAKNFIVSQDTPFNLSVVKSIEKHEWSELAACKTAFRVIRLYTRHIIQNYTGGVSNGQKPRVFCKQYPLVIDFYRKSRSDAVVSVVEHLLSWCASHAPRDLAFLQPYVKERCFRFGIDVIRALILQGCVGYDTEGPVCRIIGFIEKKADPYEATLNEYNKRQRFLNDIFH